MPRTMKPVSLLAAIRHYVNSLEPGAEFRPLELAAAWVRDRQAIEYHLRKMPEVRKSGTKPGVWIRRKP